MRADPEKNLFRAGEEHPMHILTWPEVEMLRELYRRGWSWQKLANEFGISKRQAGRVAKGQSWK